MEAAGPRRYKVSFECPTSQVGLILDTLVKEVQSPSANPSVTEGAFKVACVCMLSQVSSIVAAVVDNIDKLVIAPVDEIHVETKRFLPKPQNVVVLDESRIQKVPMRVPQRRGAWHRDSGIGKVVMSVFKDKSICHAPDFTNVLEQAGYAPNSLGATLARLRREGSVVRCGHGAYRLPTDAEQIEHRKREAGVT